MANIPVPVLRISGTAGIITFLYVVVVFGAAHLLAASFPESKTSQAWLSLGF